MKLDEIFNTPFVLKDYKDLNCFSFAKEDYQWVTFHCEEQCTGVHCYHMRFTFNVNSSVMGNGDVTHLDYSPFHEYHTFEEYQKARISISKIIYERYLKDNVIKVAEEPLNRIIARFQESIKRDQEHIERCKKQMEIDVNCLEDC